MWSKAPGSIIHDGELDELKNALGLTVRARVVVEGGVDDVWNCWNIWYNCSICFSLTQLLLSNCSSWAVATWRYRNGCCFHCSSERSHLCGLSPYNNNRSPFLLILLNDHHHGLSHDFSSIITLTTSTSCYSTLDRKSRMILDLHDGWIFDSERADSRKKW